MNITHGLRRALQINPNGLAIVYGDRRKNWREVGDRVAVNPNLTCDRCEFCAIISGDLAQIGSGVVLSLHRGAVSPCEWHHTPVPTRPGPAGPPVTPAAAEDARRSP